MSREEKSKIIRPLIKKGLKNKEIAERTGIPIGTVNGLSGAIRKELKNPVQAEIIKSGNNSDRHKCRTCQYRHSDAEEIPCIFRSDEPLQKLERRC